MAIGHIDGGAGRKEPLRSKTSTWRFCAEVSKVLSTYMQVFSNGGTPRSFKMLYYWLHIYNIYICTYIHIDGKTNGLGYPHFRIPSYVFFWIRETAPGEGHGEGEIEVTGKDEYGVYEAGGFVRGRTMTDWWISTCFNIFQPRVQESKSPRGNMNLDMNLDMIDLSNTYRYSWGI